MEDGYDGSYQERQENEVEFLQAMFPDDFMDLRKNDPWDVSTHLRLEACEGWNMLHSTMH